MWQVHEAVVRVPFFSNACLTKACAYVAGHADVPHSADATYGKNIQRLVFSALGPLGLVPQHGSVHARFCPGVGVIGDAEDHEAYALAWR
eukprot:4669175-Alexandrium_andersonii.AAC.1